MNNLLLNPNDRHHIKFFPLKSGLTIPEEERERLKLCEKLYNELEASKDAEKLFFKKNANRGYQVSVWKLNDVCYLIQSIKNEFDTYNDCVYLSKTGKDLVSIAKFMCENINTIMKDYKKQITDTKKTMVKNNVRVK